MPVEPSWLLAAMGIVELDPASVFNGPVPHGDGTVEIRSWLPSATGNLQRVMVVDAARMGRRAARLRSGRHDASGKRGRRIAPLLSGGASLAAGPCFYSLAAVGIGVQD